MSELQKVFIEQILEFVLLIGVLITPSYNRMATRILENLYGLSLVDVLAF